MVGGVSGGWSRVGGVPIVSNQVQYSLLDRRPEAELAPFARERGMGLLAYGALAGGFLSERYLGQPAPVPPFANRSLVKYRLVVDEAGGWPRLQALLDALAGVARRQGCTIPAVALRWILDRPGVSGAMIGTFGGAHLEQNLAACALELTEEDRAELAAAVDALTPLPGDAFGLERAPDGPHSAIMWKNLSAGRR